MIALVHNDSTYGAIKNIQKRAHEARYLDVELNNPDFSSSRRRTACPAAGCGARRSWRQRFVMPSIATGLR